MYTADERAEVIRRCDQVRDAKQVSEPKVTRRSRLTETAQKTHQIPIEQWQAARRVLAQSLFPS
jgi:hypothetical protein